MKPKPQIVKVELMEPLVFDWDFGNIEKNLVKHGVSTAEAEQVFNGSNKQIFLDKTHSVKERRFILIGATKNNRILYIVFTLRKAKVRVISARDLNRKEGYLYEKEA